MKLKVFFDFTCPFCYIGVYNLKKLLPKFPSIKVIWKPCQAHPRPEPEYEMDQKNPFWENIIVSGAKKINITVVKPTKPMPHSDIAIAGMHFANSSGANISEYNDKVFSSVFVNYKDIGEMSTISEILDSINVDSKEFEKQFKTNKYDSQLDDENKEAWSMMQAVPTYIFENGLKLDSMPAIGVTFEKLEEFLNKNFV